MAGATAHSTPEIAVIASRLAPAAERGYAAGDAALREDIWRIRIAIEAPGTAVTLGLAGTPAATAADGAAQAPGAPQWALDNLSVVADLSR